MNAFIDEHRAQFGVEPICETLDVSASAHYQRATGERSARAVEDERLTEVICQRHKDNFECYGQREVARFVVELRRRSHRDCDGQTVAS